MIVNVAALIAGAWRLQQQPLLPDLTGAVVLVPLAALCLLAARGKGAAAMAARAVALAASAVAGFFWSAAIGHWSLAHALPEPWEGRDIELSGGHRRNDPAGRARRALCLRC
jgi:competence protein ComEC